MSLIATLNKRRSSPGGAMLESHGKLRPELYGSDPMHMNASGYALWTSIVKPVLMERFGTRGWLLQHTLLILNDCAAKKTTCVVKKLNRASRDPTNSMGQEGHVMKTEMEFLRQTSHRFREGFDRQLKEKIGKDLSY